MTVDSLPQARVVRKAGQLMAPPPRPPSDETTWLGGHLRTGLEDTFYQPDGAKVTSNGQLIESLAACARRAGREIASPAEARQIFGIRH